MKKCLLFLIAIMCLGTGAVSAANKQPTYLDEATALGSVAGQGLACHAKKYHKFELLARAIIVSKAQSDKMQKDGLRAFNEAKADAFMTIESENFSDCDEIVYAFNRQKIFDATLYTNGKIKMPDGSLIIPRKAYNVAKLYKKDPQAFNKAEASYNKAVESALKNSEKQEKIELRDANYANFANQFE